MSVTPVPALLAGLDRTADFDDPNANPRAAYCQAGRNRDDRAPLQMALRNLSAAADGKSRALISPRKIRGLRMRTSRRVRAAPVRLAAVFDEPTHIGLAYSWCASRKSPREAPRHRRQSRRVSLTAYRDWSPVDDGWFGPGRRTSAGSLSSRRPLVKDLTKQIVIRPCQVLDLDHKLRPNPVHAAEDER